MSTTIPYQDVCNVLAGFIMMDIDLSIADPGTLCLGDAEVSAKFPPLRQPDHFIADPGTLSLSDAEVSAKFPPLRQPDHFIADPGTLRLGDAEVSAQLPCL